MRTRRSLGLSVLALATLIATDLAGIAATKTAAVGQLVLVRDARARQYGAVRIEDITPETGVLSYRWYLPMEQALSLAAADVASGTVQVKEIRGAAVVAFGPFVLEWRATTAEQGTFGTQGNLGTQPVFLASTGIHSPTRLIDLKLGFNYERASAHASVGPLGLVESFADLPKARLGFALEEVTITDEASGATFPAIRVSRVDQQSDAWSAGVREQMEVIALDHIDLYTLKDFQTILRTIEPGTRVGITILEDGSTRDLEFQAQTRVAAPDPAPTPTIDPSLPPQEQERLRKNQEVLNAMKDSVEALRALHFD